MNTEYNTLPDQDDFHQLCPFCHGMSTKPEHCYYCPGDKNKPNANKNNNKQNEHPTKPTIPTQNTTPHNSQTT